MTLTSYQRYKVVVDDADVLFINYKVFADDADVLSDTKWLLMTLTSCRVQRNVKLKDDIDMVTKSIQG